MLIYLAGPMTGYDDFNRPAFHAAARLLRRAGHTVINPAEINDVGVAYTTLVGIGEFHAVIADLVVLLPGWAGSAGALTEASAADRFGKGRFVSFDEQDF